MFLIFLPSSASDCYTRALKYNKAIMLNSLMYRTYCLTATTNFILAPSLYHKNSSIPSLKTISKKIKVSQFPWPKCNATYYSTLTYLYSALSDSLSHWILVHKKSCLREEDMNLLYHLL